MNYNKLIPLIFFSLTFCQFNNIEVSIDLNRISVPIEPIKEWQQMYAEAWRLQRDHFWVENMSGVDWEKGKLGISGGDRK